MGKKKKNPPVAEVRREKRKLLKVLVLLSRVYRKGAKSPAQKQAYEAVATSLKKLRKKA